MKKDREPEKIRKKNREIKYYVAILIVVAAFLVLSNYLPLDPFSKRITTVTALISAVAFWLQFKRTERLNESNFIMNLNNQFISNKDMTYVEHELELYYNQYRSRQRGDEPLSPTDAEEIHLGLNQSRTSEDCQKLINYLVYLEALAALVDRQVLRLDVIDDLFSYRFFLAVNNPVVQKGELYPYADYYQGIFKLNELWIADHTKRGIPIPMAQFRLSRSAAGRWDKHQPLAPLDISTARGSDKKIEIARCLYDTDRYIYPEAFGEDREKAAKAISRLIGMDGSLLDYRHLLVARYNGQICGLCLISDGKGTWDIDAVKKRIGPELLPESQEEGFSHASHEYFSQFYQREPDESRVELVACCVDEGFRRRHVAEALLTELIRQNGDKTIRLEVLCANGGAIRLYEKFGFVRVGDAFDGFAPKGLQKPKCYIMERPSTR